MLSKIVTSLFLRNKEGKEGPGRSPHPTNFGPGRSPHTANFGAGRSNGRRSRTTLAELADEACELPAQPFWSMSFPYGKWIFEWSCSFPAGLAGFWSKKRHSQAKNNVLSSKICFGSVKTALEAWKLRFKHKNDSGAQNMGFLYSWRAVFGTLWGWETIV